jgi:hypothetical protein
MVMERSKRDDDSTGDALNSRKRRRLLPQETEFLIHVFEQCPRPSTQVRDYLAARLGMSARNIQIWFQNRRAKVKRDFAESNGKTMLLFAPHSADTQSQPIMGCVHGNLAVPIRSHLSSSGDISSSTTIEAYETLNLQPPNIQQKFTLDQNHYGNITTEQLFHYLPGISKDLSTDPFVGLSADEAFSMSSPTFDQPLFNDEGVFF